MYIGMHPDSGLCEVALQFYKGKQTAEITE